MDEDEFEILLKNKIQSNNFILTSLWLYIESTFKKIAADYSIGMPETIEKIDKIMHLKLQAKNLEEEFLRNIQLLKNLHYLEILPNVPEDAILDFKFRNLYLFLLFDSIEIYSDLFEITNNIYFKKEI